MIGKVTITIIIPARMSAGTSTPWPSATMLVAVRARNRKQVPLRNHQVVHLVIIIVLIIMVSFTNSKLKLMIALVN